MNQDIPNEDPTRMLNLGGTGGNLSIHTAETEKLPSVTEFMKQDRRVRYIRAFTLLALSFSLVTVLALGIYLLIF